MSSHVAFGLALDEVQLPQHAEPAEMLVPAET
jgi:hypothetical protein